MKLLLFEMKKVWRQKKLLWLFIIVLLCTCGIFYQNLSQQSLMSERATAKMEPLLREVNRVKEDLESVRGENGFEDDLQAKQFEHVQDMGTALVYWKVAINHQEWSKIPAYEKDFLTHLQQFERYGGEFQLLQGVEREKAIAKNAWLRAYNLPYEDEEYPLSPALFLKDSTNIHFSVLSILIFLLFFGTTITAEKEQRTWLTLNTQPIPKWQLFAGKYASLLMTLFVFFIMVICLGLFIPFLFGEYGINLQYPQIIESGDTFILISTFHYLMGGAILFICASTFTFSLILLFSAWLKNSFRVLMLISSTIFLGFIVTSMYPNLQIPYNPFQYFRLSQMIGETSLCSALLYLLSAFVSSLILLALAVILPEKERSLFHANDVNKAFQRGGIQKKRSILWKFSMFEWRKMQRKRLLKQVHILLVLFIAIGYFFIYQEAKEKEAAYFDKLKEPLEEKLVTLFEQVIASLKDEDDVIVVGYEKALAVAKEQVSKNKAAVSAYEKGDWIPLYKYQLFANQFSNKEFDTGYYLNNSPDEIGKLSIDASLAEKKWLMEHHIQPVFPGEFVPTIFHYWGENQAYLQKEWEEANRKVDSSGLFSLYLYMDQYFFFVPMILFFLLLGGGLATERGKNRTLHFLMTQPLSLSHIFNGKWLASLTAALLSSIGIFSIVLLMGTIFDRFGDWLYPILIYDSASLANSLNYTGNYSQGMGFHFIPIGEYLVQSIVLFLIVLMFLLTLTIFCSLLIKNQFSLFTFVSLLAISGYALSTQTLPQMAHLSPFVYFNVAKIINGEVSTLLDNPKIHMMTGSTVLLISTLGLMVIGNIILNRHKRKIKINKDTTKDLNV
ncbi:ABC transporter permease subunit [Bacillus chungangensis]|uniref:ABC-type transport system involved in multi-copper enzyme maturation permease subunit n=1 Tax=Bacillus chungangensis TaxID=587633 RepID=A0ABT9WV11_9BACI|nr:ABC transporter permease subunit [Bacillus chungangensis]MDQ0177142.1 ABC-type transport system involved in multi-copper enzyme maturation permease subunit [Bacillus chungangensis]